MCCWCRRKLSTSCTSLGHILESRESFLSALDKRVAEANGECERKRRLDVAARVATSMDSRLNDDNVDELQMTATEFIGSSSSPSLARDQFTVKTMIDAGLHLGHSTARWNPRMAPFIHGRRHGIHIVDLDRTVACLRQACQVVRELARLAAPLLFVAIRPTYRRLCYELAMEAGQYYVAGRWIGGTLTNARAVLGSQLALHASLGADPHGPVHRPAALILLEWVDIAVAEAERVAIPTIGLCDTDRDPTKLTYPIPGNDDAYASVELVGRVLARAAQEGRDLARQGVQSKAITPPQQAVVDSAMRFSREALNQLHPGLFH